MKNTSNTKQVSNKEYLELVANYWKYMEQMLQSQPKEIIKR